MQANSPTCFCLNRDFMPFTPSVWDNALSRTWNCFRRNFFLLWFNAWLYQSISVHMLSGFNLVRLFVIPWTEACQTPLSMGFSSQEYPSGLPCPPPEDLPNSRTEPESLMSPALAGGFFTTSTTWEAQSIFTGLVFNSTEDWQVGCLDQFWNITYFLLFQVWYYRLSCI